jgi:subfamily B ATP-binding cassette protein MsbA
MKTFLRIFSYSRPYSRVVPPFIIFTLLGVLFSVANFAMIMPLLDVLFDKVEPDKIALYSQKPEFSFSLDFIIEYFNYYFIGLIENQGKSFGLLFICIILVVSVFLTNLFRAIAGIVRTKWRTKILRDIRLELFQKVSRLHMGFFTNQKRGDVISRFSNDMSEIDYTITYTLNNLFKEPVTLIVYFIVLFIISVKLTLFTLILLPITGGVIAEIVRRLRRRAIQSQDSLGRIVNIVDETLGGMRIIKAFNARNFILKKFTREIKFFKRANDSIGIKSEISSPISEFLGVSVVAGIIYYGGSLVLSENSVLSASEFITYIAIYSQVLNPSKAINKGLSEIQKGLASAKRVFSLMDTNPEITEKPDAIQLKPFENCIEFRDVDFIYETEPVLKNINFKLEKGKTVALVGTSGGGKSTMADLVPRFYDPEKGSVLIDGIDIRDCTLDSIRAIMGIVTQDSILFNDTVFNNIAFGSEEATLDDVIKAAKIANAHDFIEEMDQGYDSVMGERGTKLSGGQRQRISIARAILKNPPILILDEATSALDSESEKLVQQALSNLMQNRTSLVIAHRLSTIQHADEILVIQNGEIIERGTHDSLLLNKSGVYTKLHEIQKT